MCCLFTFQTELWITTFMFTFTKISIDHSAIFENIWVIFYHDVSQRQYQNKQGNLSRLSSILIWFGFFLRSKIEKCALPKISLFVRFCVVQLVYRFSTSWNQKFVCFGPCGFKSRYNLQSGGNGFCSCNFLIWTSDGIVWTVYTLRSTWS